MSVRSYDLNRVQANYSRIANTSVRAYGPEANGGAPKVTADEVRALFTSAKGPDKRITTDEKVRLATEWANMEGLADDAARKEFATQSKKLGLPDPKQLQSIRAAFQLKWGPSVDSPAPKLTADQLRQAITAGKDASGKLSDTSKFLIAYEWENVQDRSKTPELKAEYERLRRELQLPVFTRGGRTDARDLGIG